MEYPYNAPIILTDEVFLEYGGQTGTATNGQRQAAYFIAERQMTGHIGAFLKPTIITGSHQIEDPLVLEYGYTRNILGVTLRAVDNLSYEYSANDIANYVLIRNRECSYLTILLTPSGWTWRFPLTPYIVDIAYESGLLTGTSMQPDMLLGLTMAAQITLNEIVSDGSLANEGVGDVGIQEFSNQFYHEIRTKLGRSAFGNSAKANKVAQLTQRFRARSALRFH